MVKNLDRRIGAAEVDVREFDALKTAVDSIRRRALRRAARPRAGSTPR